MPLPASTYTTRGGVGSAGRAARIATIGEAETDVEEVCAEADEAEANSGTDTCDALSKAA